MEKKRLKIAFLSEFVGIVNRGVETYVLELSKRLRKDFDVEIVTGQNAYSFKKMLSSNFDVVIATNGRSQSLKLAIAKLLKGYKTIIPGQSGIGKDDIWNIFVSVPDVYVALTDYEMDWAKKWAWKTKLRKIPNGVDLNNFSPNGPKIKLGLEGRVILSVGALHWYKYHQRSIYAVAKTLDCSLLIIGDGEKKERLEELGNKLLGNKRFKITKVSFEDMPKYYRTANLFVLPSWTREAFGIVYVEAMACNLAVVAPDDPPRREIIGDAGVLTDVENPNNYATAILHALNRDWKKLPRSQAEKFSWDKIALEYKKLIEDLAK